MFFSVLLALALIIAVLLIIIVLLQASKGSGLAGSFGGAAQVGAVFGTRRTADFLSKATWALAAALVILVLLANVFFLPAAEKGQESVIQKSGQLDIPQAPKK